MSSDKSIWKYFKNIFKSNTTIDKYTFECSEDYNSLDLPYRYVQNLEGKYGIQRPNIFNKKLWGSVIGWYNTKEEAYDAYEEFIKQYMICERKNTFKPIH